MIICNYYRGNTDRLTGFIFDTEKKTYKKFLIKGSDWTETYYRKDRKSWFSTCLDGFKIPADISYYFVTLTECESKLGEIKKLGFIEDNDITLDFNIFKL